MPPPSTSAPPLASMSTPSMRAPVPTTGTQPMPISRGTGVTNVGLDPPPSKPWLWIVIAFLGLGMVGAAVVVAWPRFVAWRAESDAATTVESSEPVAAADAPATDGGEAKPAETSEPDTKPEPTPVDADAKAEAGAESPAADAQAEAGAVNDTSAPVAPTPTPDADPTPVEPTPVEPTPVAPTPVEPTPVEPTPTTPDPVEPTPTPDPTPKPTPPKAKPSKPKPTTPKQPKPTTPKKPKPKKPTPIPGFGPGPLVPP
jgi:hypothetical protein